MTSRVPHDADVVWSPWNGTFLKFDKPSVATIHDATPFAYPARDAAAREREQAPFRKSAETARRILVGSEFTASEVERWLGVEPERIAIVPLGADAVFHPGATGTLPEELRDRPYILHVGSHDVRKNAVTLAEAYARAFPAGEVSLAFTRRPPVLPSGALVVSAPDDESLAALYRAATLLVLPSISEGFGLPMLEALACGAPVLASHAGSLPEVGGDAVEWIDDPLDVDAWTDALRRLVSDAGARARLAALGPLRAATFSWDDCTTRTLAVLREAAG